MAEDVGCWIVTAEARVQYEARPCGTCGTKVTFEHFFSTVRLLRFSLVSIQHAPYSLICHRRYTTLATDSVFK